MVSQSQEKSKLINQLENNNDSLYDEQSFVAQKLGADYMQTETSL